MANADATALTVLLDDTDKDYLLTVPNNVMAHAAQIKLPQILETLDKMQEQAFYMIQKEQVWKNCSDKMTPVQKVMKERIKRNLKEIRDKHVEWDSFQDSANYALNSIRNIAEYEQTLYTRPNNTQINLNANNNPNPQWITPHFTIENLPKNVNPDSFKFWKNVLISWFDSGGDTLLFNRIVYSNFIRFIPKDLREQI